MRLTVKASEVRAGDVLIVPDGEHVVHRVGNHDYANDTLYWFLIPSDVDPVGGRRSVYRGAHELVVVERPDPPVTVTVDLTPAEADAWERSWHDTHSATFWSAVTKVRDAIRAARGQ